MLELVNSRHAVAGPHNRKNDKIDNCEGQKVSPDNNNDDDQSCYDKEACLDSPI